MVRESAAAALWLVLLVVAALPLGTGRLTRGAHAVVLASLFFFTAAVTRYWLQDTRSRLQIFVFVVIASVVAWFWMRRTGRSQWGVWAGWAASAAVGVMLVRWITEGSPI